MRFNISVTVLGHTFNIKGIEAPNEVQARIKVLDLLERKTEIQSVVQVRDDVDFLKKMLGIKK